MNTKFLIVTTISTILGLAIYASSTNYVFANLTTTCTGESKTHSFCSVYDSSDGSTSNWECTYHKSTKTWSCVAFHPTEGSANVPPALKDALVKAQAGVKGTGESGSNTTSITDGNALKNAGPLNGGKTDNSAPPNDTSELR